MKPGIQIRANSKFRVQVRRNGSYQSKTFGSIRAAEDWQRVTESKATADEIVDQKTAKRTTLAKACAWMIAGKHASRGANAKNLISKLRYWQRSRFANWALPSIHDWDLIEWRRDVLDEDQTEDGSGVDPDAEYARRSPTVARGVFKLEKSLAFSTSPGAPRDIGYDLRSRFRSSPACGKANLAA